ncbi:MAG: hypothetical protein WBD28_12085 [Candidatus Zixiibacteriota bacterium]
MKFSKTGKMKGKFARQWVYFYQLNAGNLAEARKFMLIKRPHHFSLSTCGKGNQKCEVRRKLDKNRKQYS